MERIRQIKSIKQLVTGRKGIKEITLLAAVVASLTACIFHEQVHIILDISMELFMQVSQCHLKKCIATMTRIWLWRVKTQCLVSNIRVFESSARSICRYPTDPKT